VSGCVGRGPSALFCPGAYNAVMTALSAGTMENAILEKHSSTVFILGQWIFTRQH